MEFRGKMRSDKFPEEWAEFIVETWCSDRCTRASERSSDEMRNPNTKKDPEWYRLHFLEKKILTIIDIINEEGKKKFHAEYEFFLGEAAALYDTKAGEAGITYAWELGDQET